MRFDFSCPVCGEKLIQADKCLKCEKGHSFDIARQGYVNLLLSQSSSSKRHGDDRLMVSARSDFLEKGYYDNLAASIIKNLRAFCSESITAADLGCGEGWYTSKVAEAFPDAHIGGIDISKYALMKCVKRSQNISAAVASIFDLPIASRYCDAVMTVFAPYSETEIKRVIKDGGVWLKAYPLERHLMGLKAAVYEKPYINDVDRSVPDGFVLLNREEIKYKISLESNDDILNLFKMTPYFYKTGRQDQEKLSKLDTLDTEVEFGLDIYKKTD